MDVDERQFSMIEKYLCVAAKKLQRLCFQNYNPNAPPPPLQDFHFAIMRGDLQNAKWRTIALAIEARTSQTELIFYDLTFWQHPDPVSIIRSNGYFIHILQQFIRDWVRLEQLEARRQLQP